MPPAKGLQMCHELHLLVSLQPVIPCALQLLTLPQSRYSSKLLSMLTVALRRLMTQRPCPQRHSWRTALRSLICSQVLQTTMVNRSSLQLHLLLPAMLLQPEEAIEAALHSSQDRTIGQA